MDTGRVHDERIELGDAFGRALQICQGAGGAFGAAVELIERSDGCLMAADVARYFVTQEEWTGTCQAACDQLSGRVLDIGAGAGRAGLLLQQRGIDVVALDVSPGATTVCRERGVDQTFTGTVFDLAQTDPEPFDAFVMLGNNLGLLGSAQEAPAFLEALAGMAATGARVVGETLDPYATEDPLHLGYHEENRRLGRLPGQIRLRIRYARLATPWYDYLFCTPEELDEVVAPTRWRLVGVTGGPEGEPAPAGNEGAARPRSWPHGQWTATLGLTA